MTETRTATVEIFGREYRIKGVADRRYIEEVAGLIDRKMKDAAEGTSLPTHDRLAILAAMNIVDEVFQERQRASEAYARIEAKADALIGVLERTLRPGG